MREDSANGYAVANIISRDPIMPPVVRDISDNWLHILSPLAPRSIMSLSAFCKTKKLITVWTRIAVNYGTAALI
jgi:hypothetical protein